MTTQFLHKRDEVFLQTVGIIPQVLCNDVKHKEYMQKTQVVLSYRRAGQRCFGLLVLFSRPQV